MSTLHPSTRITALIVASAFFMQMLDGAIITTSLPQMAGSFGVQPVHMSVGITTYMLVVAIFMPLSAWLADRFGARRIFLAAILVFTLASLACGLAQTLTQFVLARALQGLGGAMMMPVGRTVVLRQAAKSELLDAVALITWPALFAPVIGPVLGGFITTYLSWRWNFFLNLPVGIAGFLLARRFIPDFHSESCAALDRTGFVLSASALAFLLYGLETLGHGALSSATPWLLIAIGLGIGAFALRHLNRSEHPLLNLEPFGVQTFSLATLSAGTWLRIAINATPFLLPLLYQLGFGLSALAASSYVFAYFAGNLGMKTITTPTLRRFGFRHVLFVNGLLCGLSIAACALFTADTARILMFASLFLAGLTRSMQFTALNTLAFADLPDAQRSSASTLSSMLQQIAMLLGVAISVLILQASSTLLGNATPALADFRVAFVLIGLLASGTAWMFLKLPQDAGAEVSGHRIRAASQINSGRNGPDSMR